MVRAEVKRRPPHKERFGKRGFISLPLGEGGPLAVDEVSHFYRKSLIRLGAIRRATFPKGKAYCIRNLADKSEFELH